MKIHCYYSGNRYRVNTFPIALDIMRDVGYLWNVGQIAPHVVTQLYMAVREGKVIQTHDGYPLGGDGGIAKVKFTLNRAD